MIFDCWSLVQTLKGGLELIVESGLQFQWPSATL
jgi:hypothetical protein